MQALLLLAALAVAFGQTTINLNNQIEAGGSCGGDKAMVDDKGDDKWLEWTFEVEADWAPYNALTADGAGIEGFIIDLVNAVGMKNNAKIFWQQSGWSECMTSSSSVKSGWEVGRGLGNRWFDACAGGTRTATRQLTIGFTNPITEVSVKGVFVNPTGSHTAPTGGNKLNIGIVDSWVADKAAVLNYIKGLTGNLALTADQVNIVTVGNGDQTLLAAKNGQTADGTSIDAVLYTSGSGAIAATGGLVEYTYKSDLGDVALPALKSSPFIPWWNKVFPEFQKQPEFKEMCCRWGVACLGVTC